MNKFNRRQSSSSSVKEYKDNKFKMIFKNSPVATFLQDGSALKKSLKVATPQSGERHSALHEKSSNRKNRMIEVLRTIKILEVNRAAVDLFEAANEIEVSTNFIDAIHKGSIKILFDALSALVQGMDFFEADIRINTFKGNRCDCLLRVSVPKDSQESLSRFIVSLQDITARKAMEQYLRKMAQLDGLTKLFNHYAIIERLEEELNRAKRYGLELSCLMIDVDHFKLINDQFGHQKGDQILRQVARLIKEKLRKSDVLGRYGGDEFFIILPETRPKSAIVPATRIQQAFKNKMSRYSSHLGIANTLSVGISGYPAKGINDFKDMIEVADKAMYQAKSSGRYRIVVG